MLWKNKSKLLETDKITKEDYDDWRYNSPDKNTSPHFAEVISPGLNDLLMEELKKIEKEEKKESKKNNKK